VAKGGGMMQLSKLLPHGGTKIAEIWNQPKKGKNFSLQREKRGSFQT